MNNLKLYKFRSIDFSLLFLGLITIIIYLSRVNIGLDFSDAGYSLARYRLFSGEGLDNNFFLSNKLGSLILNFNNTAMFLRFISYSIYSVLTIISYTFWNKKLKSKKISMLSAVTSLLFAMSFPLEILHNSITAIILFTIFIVFVKYEENRDNLMLALLSILSVLSIFFRVSNIAFIVVIFLYLLMYNKKDCLKYILYIIVEFAFIVLILVILNKFDRVVHLLEYFKFLLFNKTNHNMLLLAYRLIFNFAFILIPIYFIEFIDRKLIKHYVDFLDLKISNILIILGIIISLFMGYSLYGNYEIFPLNSLFYKMFLIVLYLSLFNFRKNKTFKIAMFLFFALPFGTSNIFYYQKICMFLVMPMLFLSLENYILKRKYLHYISTAICCALVVIMTYIYPYRDEIIFNLKYESNVPQLKGIKTSEEKVKSLNRVSEVLNSINWKEYRLITDGSIPLFSYITEAYSVHKTTWPDLDSYSLKKYRQDIELLTKKMVIVKTKVPTVKNYWKYDEIFDSTTTEKEKILYREIENRKLKKIYEDDFFIIWN